MGFPKDLFRQTATYWPPASGTKFDAYGDPIFGTVASLAPSSVTGIRWENRTEKFINASGDESHSRALVWSVNTVFEVGGYLYLGTSVAANPETVSGADQIRRVESVPDIKGGVTVYKAIL